MIDLVISGFLGFIFGTFFGIWIISLLAAGEDKP